MSNLADSIEVRNVQTRVPNRLHEERFGVFVDGLTEIFRVALIDKFHIDAELGQRVVKQVVGAAIETGRRDNVLARMAQVHDGQRLGSLTRRGRQGPRSPFEQRESLLEDVGRGVHQAGVDIAEFLQSEQPRGVIAVIEDVRGRLIQRQGARIGRRVGDLSAVQAQCRQFPGLIAHESLQRCLNGE